MFNEELEYVNQLYETSLPINFNDYYNILKNININIIDMTSEEYEYEYDLGEYVRKCVMGEIKELVKISDDDVYTISTFLENLSPYITLRILSENKNNLDLDLIWRVSDVVENGWILEKDIIPQLTTKEKILIVTEGSSDTDIVVDLVN